MGLINKIKEKANKTKEVINNAKTYMSICKPCRKSIEHKMIKKGITDIDKLTKDLCPTCKNKFDDVE